MIAALITGILLGLSAGLAPGPLLALVLAQTLRHGVREGCKVALSPLITDAPIILLTLFLAAKVAQVRPLLGVISLAGGVFVLYLAWVTFRPAALNSDSSESVPGSWFKGILTNVLSPHPWLFWLTVGAATLARAIADSWMAAGAFLFGFYSLLLGSKVLIAVIAARWRGLLGGRTYRLVMQALGLLLAAFAVLLCMEGVRHLAA